MDHERARANEDDLVYTGVELWREGLDDSGTSVAAACEYLW